MDRRARRDLAAWLCTGVLAATAFWMMVSTALSALDFRSPGPMIELWRFLPVIEAFDRGEGEISALLEPHGSHRLFFPKLFYLAEYRFFAGQNDFLLASSAVLGSLSALLLVGGVWRERARLPPPVLCFLIAATLALLFSGTQIENFTRPWNLHWFLTHALLIASLASLARAGSARETTSNRTAVTAFASSVAAAAVCSYSMATGVAAWPALVFSGFLLRFPLRWVASLGAAALLIAASFFADPSWMTQAAWPEVDSPAFLVEWLAACFGSPLAWSHRSAGVLLGIAGVLAGLALATQLAIRRPPPRPIEAILAGTLVFTLASGLLTTVGRASLSSGSWIAPRYQTMTLLFWLSAVGLAVLRLPRSRLPVMIGFAIWTLAVLVPAHRSEVRKAAAFAAAARAANAAILVGIPHPPAYKSILPLGHCRGGDCVSLHRAFLEARGLGVFADGRADLMSRRIGEDLTSASEPCPGELGEVEVIRGKGTGRLEEIGARLSGRVRNRAGPILITDVDGRITGLGEWLPRAAAPETGAHTQPLGRGWVAYSRPPERGGRLEVWALEGERRACRVAGPVNVWPGRFR